MRRRQAFLELALERLGIENAEVLGERAEELPADVYDGAVARAFAPAGVSWKVARRVLRPGGRLVYFAGRAFDGRTPEGADVRVVRPGRRLESAGPLVIMTAR
jgi:16S rRNA G527 N7-methylase RsmG